MVAKSGRMRFGAQAIITRHDNRCHTLPGTLFLAVAEVLARMGEHYARARSALRVTWAPEINDVLQ